MYNFKRLLTLIFCLIFTPIVIYAQEGSSTFVSSADHLLNIRKIILIPLVDNVGGIYSRPLEGALTNLIDNDPFWDRIDLKEPISPMGPYDLIDKSEKIKKWTTLAQTDAAISARISKSPGGVSIKMALFLGEDGKLIAEKELKQHPNFDLKDLKIELKSLYKNLKQKLPYSGIILSRRGTEVTINLNKSHGIKKGQTLSVVQILKIKRHPKFHFIVNTEKSILGKVRITKVDDTLSFGKILSERALNTIKRSNKIGKIDFIYYSESNTDPFSPNYEKLKDQPGSNISFGKKPNEWQPSRKPSFGRVSFLGGLSSYRGNQTLSDNIGALSTRASIYPTFRFSGELWFTPQFFASTTLKTGLFTTSNPLSDSEPEKLNNTFSRYSFHFGYNFLMEKNFWGSKLQLLSGFTNYRLKTDASSPQGLTTMNYSGFNVGVGGSFPINYKNKKTWDLGFQLYWHLNPALTESPVSSGKSENSVNHFLVSLNHHWSSNMRLSALLEFETYNSSFSGPSNRTCVVNGTSLSCRGIDSSQSHSSLMFGVDYLF